MKLQKVSEALAEQIAGMILEGALKPGERLPPERGLAEEFDVSRNSLREALRNLAARGLIESRHGGGNFVTKDFGRAVSQPLVEMFKNRPETVHEVLEMRRLLDSEAAALAALRATDEDRILLRRRFDELLRVQAQPGLARQHAEVDLDFHLAVAEAAHNVMLSYMLRNLYELLVSSIQRNLGLLTTRESTRQELVAQHQAIFECVSGGDSEGARSAAARHIDFVAERMRLLDEEEVRRKSAIRRLHGLTDTH